MQLGEPAQQHARLVARLRVTGGGLETAQLKTLAEAAERYGRGRVHLTTRQVEIPDVRFGDVEKLREELARAGLEFGGCGPRVRTITIRQSIIPPEILQQLQDIDADYQTSIQALNAGISELTNEIRKEVLENGDSVKATNLHAILVKGRTSWDTKALDGYVVAHPEILVFRKHGEPSVSIRRVSP